MEQSTPLEASEHFVPLPESLDEERSENSNQQDKSHPKTKWWGALESLGNGPGLEPQLTCLSAGASLQLDKNQYLSLVYCLGRL